MNPPADPRPNEAPASRPQTPGATNPGARAADGSGAVEPVLVATLRKLLRGLLAALGFLVQLALIGWGTLALFYAGGPLFGVRLVLAAGFLAFGVLTLWVVRGMRGNLIFAAIYIGLLAWWSTLLPSHDRDWRADVSALPRATIDGDRVRISGVRHFEYRSRDDFTKRYEDREVLLSHLTAVDLFVSYWKVGPVAHTFVSFCFDNAPPVCISIETRPEQGESYAPVASMFKQFELIYVVGDERDLVRVRTDHRDEEVFLYRVRTSPEGARLLFLTYLERINELADRAEFYHLLSNSCTINIVRYANASGRIGGFHIGHLLNGWIDRYLYSAGSLDSALPFEELRARSHINRAARQAGSAEDFSDRIRTDLPTIPSP